jgi:hypothetical protein
MKPVIQQDITGCGIASIATLVGVTYRQAQHVAQQLGISVEDRRLWSNSIYVRTLLRHYGVRASDVRASDKEQPFHSWNALPGLALLAIKWHSERGRAFWHGGILPPAAWGCCTGPEARTPHESAYRLRSHETKMVHRNPGFA